MDSSIIKVTDFGLARFVENELATTACGTPNYVAPEIIAGKGYSKEVDLWSIGVIIYIMLCGFPPFYDDNNTQLFKLI
jgi:calcium/calmodulin-dependent protein kinase I